MAEQIKNKTAPKKKRTSFMRKAVSAGSFAGSYASGFAKNCCTALKEAVPSAKSMYSSKAAALEKEMGVKKNIYTSALAMTYTMLSVPDQTIRKACGPIVGNIVSPFLTGGLSSIKVFTQTLDFTTYKAVFTSIIGAIKQCFPKALSVLWNGLINMISDLWGLVKSYVKSKKYVARIAQRQMLTEAKRQSLLRRAVDWLKDKAAKIAQACKSSLVWILKNGFKGFSYLFLKFVHPIAECMSNNNNIKFDFKSMASASVLQGAGAGVLTTLGLGSMTGALAPLVVPLAGLFTFFASITYVFSVAGWLNNAGFYVEMGDMALSVGEALFDI